MVNQGQIRRYRSIEDQARLSVYYFVVAKKNLQWRIHSIKRGEKNPISPFSVTLQLLALLRIF